MFVPQPHPVLSNRRWHVMPYAGSIIIIIIVAVVDGIVGNRNRSGRVIKWCVCARACACVGV